jgi:hypothetical protein
MSKLFLFATGGTGTRVLKSLTMILASGVKTNCEEIVPMIIDTDVNNGDLEKFRRIISNYQQIHNTLYKGASAEEADGYFFRTKISKPKELNISGLHYKSLQDMIGYETMPANGLRSSKGLADLLFSKHNKTMNLEKGFLGNPNVGSIVLKDVVESEGFKEFTQEFREGDRILIVNSIFGGTGAAAYPLLMNLFRFGKDQLNNSAYFKDAVIGGVTILPYFEVDQDAFKAGDSAIDSNTFVTKTKAALSYYDKHLSQLIDAQFYIGDTRKSNYANVDGGTKQENPANFIEFGAALAAIEFMSYDEAGDRNKLANKPLYFEFGIEGDTEQITLNHLKSVLKAETKALVKFSYFNLYLTNFLQGSLSNSKLSWRNQLGLSNDFYSNQFMKALRGFAEDHYYLWKWELNNESHGRRFLPFMIKPKMENSQKGIMKVPVQLDCDQADLFSFVNGVPAENSSSFWKKDHFGFDEVFNETAEDLAAESYPMVEQRFNAMINEGMKTIIEKRFKNQL